MTAYREKLGSDVAVIEFMDRVDEMHRSGDIQGSQERVREFFEACAHFVTGG